MQSWSVGNVANFQLDAIQSTSSSKDCVPQIGCDIASIVFFYVAEFCIFTNYIIQINDSGTGIFHMTGFLFYSSMPNIRNIGLKCAISTHVTDKARGHQTAGYSSTAPYTTARCSLPAAEGDSPRSS